MMQLIYKKKLFALSFVFISFNVWSAPVQYLVNGQVNASARSFIMTIDSSSQNVNTGDTGTVNSDGFLVVEDTTVSYAASFDLSNFLFESFDTSTALTGLISFNQSRLTLIGFPAICAANPTSCNTGGNTFRLGAQSGPGSVFVPGTGNFAIERFSMSSLLVNNSVDLSNNPERFLDEDFLESVLTNLRFNDEFFLVTPNFFIPGGPPVVNQFDQQTDFSVVSIERIAQPSTDLSNSNTLLLFILGSIIILIRSRVNLR